MRVSAVSLDRQVPLRPSIAPARVIPVDTAAIVRRALRRTSRRLVAALPRSARHALIRRQLAIPAALPKGLRFKVAETREELEAAFALLHDAYVEQHFIEPQPSGLYLTPQHALPSTSTLIAVLDGQVVGTVTLVRSNPLGLSLEKAFDLGGLRQNGARIAEVSSLAIHRDVRRDFGGAIFFPLTCFLFRYSVHYFGLDYYVIVVYPQHADFYESIFCFDPLGDEIVENYLGAPAAAFSLDLKAVPVKFAARYGGLPPGRNAYEAFVERPYSEFEFPDRRYAKISDPVMTPELLDYFFNKRSNLFSTLDNRQRQALAFCYRRPEYDGVLPPIDETVPPVVPGEERYDVRFKGQLRTGDRGRRVPMSVVDVSRFGFKARPRSGVHVGQELVAMMAVGDFALAELRAVPLWADEDGTYGFRVLDASESWSKFVDYLATDLHKKTAQ